MLRRLALVASTLALTSLLGCTSGTGNNNGGDYYGGGSGTDSGGGSDSGSGDTGTPGNTSVDEPLPVPLRTISVDNEQALRDALASAEPGDLIELRDQVWTFSSAVDIVRNGTAEHPIVISAETIGGATIDGVAGFHPTGASHVVLRGFDFRFTAGARGITCDNCSYVRFTRNHFELKPIDYSHWLVLGGTSHDNRIDRNVFINKATRGNFLTFDGTDTQVATNNVIELNYFANQTWNGSNEGECIRLGRSGLKFSKGYNVIQHNLFEHCDGDPEVLSVKSSNNTIRFNTFRNNAGALVFRHGDASQAIGNYFFSNNGGIRFYGDDHRIVNNYFEGNRGTGVRSTIVIGSGTALDDTPTSSVGYDASERVLLAFNTLVDNESDIQIGNSSTDTVGAIDCTLVDNLLSGNAGTFAHSITAYSGFTWSGNLLSGAATTGEFPANGYTHVDDAKLVELDGFEHLAADSPARDAATGTYPDIADDVEGTARTGTFDIGAVEYSATPANRRPLQASDVGPSAP